MLDKVFSPVTRLGFGARGRVGGVILVLRNSREMSQWSVQNGVEIGPTVPTQFKDIVWYLQSFFIKVKNSFSK